MSNMSVSAFEIVGLLGTLIVLVSHTRTDIRQIRIINLIGSILFVVYGIAISAWSTAILNICCIFIHFYHLHKLKNQDTRY